MAWAACWTLLRSRPLQQLGEQGDVGRGRPLVFRSFCSLQASCCSSSFCVPSLICPWLGFSLSIFLSLSSFALQSGIGGSLVQLLCGPLLVQAVVGLGTCETQVCHETSQDLLEALLQACNFVFQLLTPAASALAEDPLMYSGATDRFLLSSCLTPSLLPCGSILTL